LNFIRLLLLSFSVVLASTVVALTPTPAPPQSQPIALVGGTIHIGNGQVIDRGVVTFAEGKITGVFGDPNNSQIDRHQVIDVLGQHIYPGFISVDTDLGLREVDAVRHTRDETERGELNPSVRSLIAYNTDSEMIPTLRFNGLLTAQITPRGGLVSGSSSIVQLDAWNWEDAALVTDDAIHITWPSKKKREFDFTTFSVKTVDDKTYDERLLRLKALFQEAAAYRQANLAEQGNLKFIAMTGLFSGEKSVFVATNEPTEIVDAVRFLREVGIPRVALKATDGALEVAEFLKAQEIPVIVTGLHRLPAERHHPIDQPFTLPTKLTAAGLTIALSNPSLMNSRNLGFLAGTAAAYGLEREQALQTITANAAKILGIEDRLGTIEEGKNATLFISAGDALDMRGQRVSLAFIDGRQIELEGRQQQLFQRFKQKFSQ